MLNRYDLQDRSNPAWIKIVDKKSSIRRHTDQMKKQIEERMPMYQTRLSADLLELLSILCLATHEAQKQQSEWPLHSEQDTIVAQILTVMERFPIHQILLSEVASQLNCSPRHLSRIFPSHFGLTFKKYVQELRLQESQKLLQDTSLTVQDVMQQVGFKDRNHFYALFKKKTGLTPGQFRKSTPTMQRLNQK